MKFDGIFAVNDIAAVRALQALQAAQISVPQEVAIIGYSDWQFSSFISPTLTTIRQNGNEMGRKAAELLLEEIHSKDTFSASSSRCHIAFCCYSHTIRTVNLHPNWISHIVTQRLCRIPPTKCDVPMW